MKTGSIEKTLNWLIILVGWSLLLALSWQHGIPIADHIFLLLAVATVIGGLLQVEIPMAQVTETTGFEYLALMFLGPIGAAWVSVIGQIAKRGYLREKNITWYLRTTAKHALSILVASVVFYTLGGGLLVQSGKMLQSVALIPIYATVATHFAINLSMDCMFVLLKEKKINYAKLWRRSSWDFAAKLIFAPLVYFVYLIYMRANAVDLILPVGFLLFVWIFFHKSIELSITKSRLVENLERIKAQRDIARITNTSLKVNEILQALVKSVCELNGIMFASINLIRGKVISDKPSAASSMDSPIWQEMISSKLYNRLMKISLERGDPIFLSQPRQFKHLFGPNYETQTGSGKLGLVAIYPLKTNEEQVGLMTIGAINPEHVNDVHADTLDFLLDELSVAIHNAQLHEELKTAYEERNEELKYAAKVQRIMLPKAFMTERVKIETSFKSARIIGGDFFEIFPRFDGQIVIAIGDVSGKGIPAALTMMRILSLLRQLTRSSRTSVEILNGLNDEMDWEKSELDNVSQYATCFLALFDPRTGVMRYSSAGHVNPFIFIKKEKRLGELKGGGFPLGMFPNGNYEEDKISLVPGDKLVMYTDGATDAVDPNGDRLTSRRLHDLVLRKCQEDGNTALKIYDEIMTYREDAQIADDIAIVTCEYLEGLFNTPGEDEASARIERSSYLVKSR